MNVAEISPRYRAAVSPLWRISCLLLITGCRISAWAVGIRSTLITAPAAPTASLRRGSRENIPRYAASGELCSMNNGRWTSRDSVLVMANTAKDGDSVLKRSFNADDTPEAFNGLSQEKVKLECGRIKVWERVRNAADVKGVKVKISDHVSDVRSFVETVLPGLRPIIVSHSLGGMVLLKLMEELDAESQSEAGGGGNGNGSATSGPGGIQAAIAGGVFLCSVPPSGNDSMTKRFIKERPLMVVKLVLGFVLKMAVFWPWLARELFFSQALEQSTLKRYMSNFQADSKNSFDLLDLRGELPSKNADADGRASWARRAPPRFVIGTERDRIVDETGIQEMAAFLDTEHVMLPTVPHEVMLGPDWPLGADRLLQWLETTDFIECS